MNPTIDAKLVSVIVPCFNDGAYLEETIQSILNQTYSRIEIVVTDDGSTDPASHQYLSDVEKKYKIQVIRSENKGPSAARNLAIKNSKGFYILPLDADDLIKPTYIEKAVKILEEHPEVGLVYCKAETFGVKTGPWDLPIFNMDEFAWDNQIFNAGIYRRQHWEEIGGYDESLIHGSEDYDFWVALIKKNLSPFQLPEVLFSYRIKKVSRSTRFATTSLKHKVETYAKIFANNLDFYEKNLLPFMKRRLFLEKSILLAQENSLLNRQAVVRKGRL